MKKIRAHALKEGDKIGVVSPASKPSDEEKYYKGIEYLQQLGYDVVHGKSVLSERGYLAGFDEDRISDINEMFSDQDIKAIFCSRGGYGAPRILNEIDYKTIRKNPKIFIGYSDITTMNLGIYARTGLVTFSGPMVAVEMGGGINEFSERSLWENLTNSEPGRELRNPDDVELNVIKDGEAEGVVVPGCFSVFSALLGSPYVPDLKGAILVLEDIEEDPYRIDRYFAQLKISGILDVLGGIVFGQFIDCVPKDNSKPTLSTEEIIWDYVKDLNIPVMSDFAYGHGMIKLTLPIGVRVRLDTSTDYLQLLEPTVKE